MYTLPMNVDAKNAIRSLTLELEKSISRNPLLNIDTFLIPSPYIRESNITKDYTHSLVWVEEGEILGYILVYSDRTENSYMIYKLVTSPFVRKRGIGSALGQRFLSMIPPESNVYVYVWEKQTDSMEFFLNRGFQLGDTMTYRNLVFFHLFARCTDVLEIMQAEAKGLNSVEEIGKTRHDARKTIRLLSNMVDMLSIDNSDRIIEDINRETTSLVNTLNSFRDTMNRVHEVNVTELILERIIPYVGGSNVNCELRLKLQKINTLVLGNHVNFGRAFINIVANSLESIEASGREDGIMEIKIGEDDNGPYVRFRDNGVGMTPEQLKRNPDGIPAFVGHSTKIRREGEGLGSLQVFSTFSPENIVVEGRPNRGCTWKIWLRKPTHQTDPWYARLERRFNEFVELSEMTEPTGDTSRQDVIAYVRQTRKIEIFLFDVILHFSTYHNIRTIFRTVFSFLVGDVTEESLKEYLESLRVDRLVTKEWLIKTAEIVRNRRRILNRILEYHDVRGAMFKSYGQAVENVIIFTLNPETGLFYSTDRKLAEHLDFAPYLGADKEQLLRGEFIGDVNNNDKPIFLGVWSIDSEEGLVEKLQLLQKGVRKLIEIGIHPEKKLAFYQTTYIRHNRDIDSDAVVTFEEFAQLTDEGLHKYAREADDELQGYLSGQD